MLIIWKSLYWNTIDSNNNDRFMPSTSGLPKSIGTYRLTSIYHTGNHTLLLDWSLQLSCLSFRMPISLLYKEKGFDSLLVLLAVFHCQDLCLLPTVFFLFFLCLFYI